MIMRTPQQMTATLLVALLTVACAPSRDDAPSDVPAGAAVAESPAVEGPTAIEERQLELASFDSKLGAFAEFRGGWDEIVERGYVRALVTPSRTHYFLDGATQRGLTYEGLREFEAFLNRRLGRGTLAVRVLIIPVHRDELLPALERGLGDLAAANLTVTPERLERVDFAAPFADNVRELVVTGPSGPALHTLDDLAGVEVYVRRSSSFWASLEALSADFAARGLEPVKIEPAEEFLETEDLLEMVSAGVLPATVADEHIARFWGGVLDHLTVHDGFPIREGGAIAWAVRKDAPGLTEVVGEFARKFRVGTLTTNVLLGRYLRDNAWVRNPVAAGDWKRFEATVGLFRTYGERYGFDHLMLTALAYQESKLDQSVKSSAGAVGVMQIKPETAADPNVGIPDIHRLEDNIHAGARYLDFLRDRYFSDPRIPQLDRHLLTFAAYNAGPARVAKLRAEAAEMGLDPNRWFGNVEVVAARRIGAETVQYVANIAKYYVAYSRAAALAAGAGREVAG